MTCCCASPENKEGGLRAPFPLRRTGNDRIKGVQKAYLRGERLTRDWPYDFDLPITAAGAPDTSLIHVFRTNLRGEVAEVTAFSVDAETGTLTYPTSGSPLETGEKLTILRLLDVRQQFFDPSNQANLYPETLEDNTDRLVMLVQQIQEETVRAVKVSVSTDPDEEDKREGSLRRGTLPCRQARRLRRYVIAPAIAYELDVNLVMERGRLRAKLTFVHPMPRFHSHAHTCAEDSPSPARGTLVRKDRAASASIRQNPHHQRPCRRWPLADIRGEWNCYRHTTNRVRLSPVVRSSWRRCYRRYHTDAESV